jgi:RNA polymerase sigma-70 factor (ECF subfamily)
MPTSPSRTLPPTPIAEERARILYICLRATHDHDAAEDLAQDTLLEAWRHWEKLREPDDEQARARWLAAIATNVCRRWARTSSRECTHTTNLIASVESQEPAAGLDVLSHEGDAVDSALEHAERARLLDRALGLLQPEIREALIARYLLEQPLSEIAARNGLSEATLSVRLHRGKQALRAHLATTLREEALAYGLLPVTDEGWQVTRLWCPQCGRARLQGLLGGSPVHLRLRCPECMDSNNHFIEHTSFQGILDGVTSFTVARNRVLTWADSYYRSAAVSREVICRCGRMARVMQTSDTSVSPLGEYSLSAICTCPAENHTDIANMALSTAEGRRFWRAHPRIHRLPESIVEAGGREVIVVGYQAMGGVARLDTLFARDTYELLNIHQAPGT